MAKTAELAEKLKALEATLPKAEDMNLKVLQRFDNSITSIIEKPAGHVVVYSFKNETGSWEKLDIVGSLFLFQRMGNPPYGLFVLNRQSMQNLIEYVGPGFEMSVQDPFMMIRTINGTIYGLWFYEQEDRLRIQAGLGRITQYAYGQPPVPQGQAHPGYHPHAAPFSPPVYSPHGGPGPGYVGSPQNANASAEIMGMLRQNPHSNTGSPYPAPRTPQHTPASMPQNYNNPQRDILSMLQTASENANTPQAGRSDKNDVDTAKLAEAVGRMHMEDEKAKGEPNLVSVAALKDILLDKLENDRDFMRKVHAAYVSEL
eukprot:Clim_evm30s157 gene=Clim_evmTU30s157